MIHTINKKNLCLIFFILLFSLAKKTNTLNSDCNKTHWGISLAAGAGASFLAYYLLKNEYIKTPEILFEHKNITCSLVGLLTFGTVQYTLKKIFHKSTTTLTEEKKFPHLTKLSQIFNEK